MSETKEPANGFERCLAAVREAADIASTFDGRMTYEPVTGGVKLTFSHPGRPSRTASVAVDGSEAHVRITLRHMDAGEPDEALVYEGPAKPAPAMNAAMQAIARWYRDEINRLASR
ncbi:hypothetical protein [Alicyclobacillus fructus]|uniref:hypothetical protein n=1 Tax=Alicyclobacillus fructus TaxID=2816082 RepID=UPI001A8C8B35|nr:hypothetical protein [Alicyclobacillus fructus]